MRISQKHFCVHGKVVKIHSGPVRERQTERERATDRKRERQIEIETMRN
jgi:hypothetical protein